MTSLQKSDGPVLKADTKGRVQTPAARRETLLNEFEKSGLSGAKFAALVGVKYPTFAAWAARRRKQGATKAPVKPVDQVHWLETVVEQAQTSVEAKTACVLLHLPGGARLELAEVKQVPLAVALLRALEKPC
jgi:hypothetical protein